jgi:glycine/D-amino acid oxidase-like deaminating enzyme
VEQGAFTLDAQGYDQIVCALGAWTPHALPWLAGEFRSTGHPVFHLKPPDEALAAAMPVFCADITATGYYGFPLLNGVVKIARHGPGRVMHPESRERFVTEEETAHLRAFLRESMPWLADAPIVNTRICLYCDSQDGHFWIARDPERPHLVVCAGDSGHAFKFAPVLGALVAGVVEGKAHEKFRWRPGQRSAQWQEASRQRASR